MATGYCTRKPFVTLVFLLFYCFVLYGVKLKGETVACVLQWCADCYLSEQWRIFFSAKRVPLTGLFVFDVLENVKVKHVFCMQFLQNSLNKTYVYTENPESFYLSVVMYS